MVMLSDDTMGFFVGFLLDYGFNWQEVLKSAEWEVCEASWKRYVDEYGHSLPVPKRRRSELPQIKIPLLDVANEDESHDDATLRLRKAWLERMKMKERTVGSLLSLVLTLAIDSISL